MKRISLALTVVLAAAAAFAADVRKQTFTYPAAGTDRVKVEIPVGDLVVIASSSPQIRVEMTVRCSSTSSRCKETAEDIELVSDRLGSSLDLEIDGYPEHTVGSAPSVDLTIWMPPGADLRSNVGVGDTIVKGLEADVDVHCGVGDMTLNALESKVRSVHLESGVGSAKMFVKKRPVDVPGFLFLGHELNWNEGHGDARVEVEAGVGSVHVSID